MTTRVVCENTLNAALAERDGITRQVAVRHTRGAFARVEEARRVLGIAVKYFDVFGARCRALSAKQLTEETLRRYLHAVFPPPDPPGNPGAMRRLHDALAFLFEKGRGNELSRVNDTAWAAYNAVMEWVDHVRGVTESGPRANRGEHALFGRGDEIKRRAFSMALHILR